MADRYEEMARGLDAAIREALPPLLRPSTPLEDGLVLQVITASIHQAVEAERERCATIVYNATTVECRSCYGAGVVRDNYECPVCHGSGETPEPNTSPDRCDASCDDVSCGDRVQQARPLPSTLDERAKTIARHYVSELDGNEEDVYANLKADIEQACRDFAREALYVAAPNCSHCEDYVALDDSEIAACLAAAERGAK